MFNFLSPIQERNPWLNVMKPRDSPAYKSYTKFVQAVEQRSLGIDSQRIPRPYIETWLESNKFRAGDFQGDHNKLKNAITAAYNKEDQEIDFKVAANQELAAGAQTSVPAPNTMPQYVDVDDEISLNTEALSIVPSTPTFTTQTPTFATQTPPDIDGPLPTFGLPPAPANAEDVVDFMIAQAAGSPTDLTPLPIGIINPAFLPTNETDDETDSTISGTTLSSATSGSSSSSTSASIVSALTAAASPFTAGIVNVTNQRISDDVLANILKDPQAMSMTRAMGYDLSSPEGVKSFYRYLTTRAELVLMRANPSKKPRAKNNTAAPKRYFNFEGSHAQVRYS